MTVFKLKLKVDEKDLQQLRDAKEDSPVSAIRVKIEATHSGIINKNSWFYTPQGMAAGTKSFVKPYPKPVLVNHDAYSDPLGRVEKAKYVDYGIDSKWIGKITASKSGTDLADSVKGFVKTSVFKAASYKGLGHVELIASITDAEAIDKVLKGEYLTVSISGSTDMAVCSVCGNDLKDEEQRSKCSHYPGDVYDGEECFFISGNMEFSEVSYVNMPADKFAKSEVIRDSEQQVYLEDCRLEIIDFDRSGDNKRGENLKKFKLKEVLSDKSIVDNVLKEMGLGDSILAPEALNKIRKTSFLFSDEMALPVHDKAHVLAAYKVLDMIEDSEEEVEAARSVLDGKFKRMFNSLSVEDAMKLVVKDNEQPVQDAKSQTIDVDAIVNRVIDAIKSHVKVDDSYLFQRNQILEREIEELESEYNKLTDSYRLSLVDQILATENRLSDSAYKDRLQKRSLESLADKLNDLRDQDNSEEPSSEEPVSEDQTTETKLADKSLSVEDAAEKSDELQDSAETTKNEEKTKFSVGQFNDEYKKVLKESGLYAASKWVQQVKDENRFPEELA